MKTRLTSFDVVQNISLSAIALHTFTVGYNNIACKKNNKPDYPKLEYFFYILPLIYHQNSLEYFHNRHNLYTVLSKYPELVTQLEHRANKMSEQTFDALNLAFSRKILNIKIIDNKSQISLIRKTLINESYSHDVKKIINGSKKLGYFFAKETEKNIQIKLNIRF